MPRGGRRHAVPLATHLAMGTYRVDRHGARLESPRLPPMRPPPPPKNLDPAEREAWIEVAQQLSASRTYTRANYSAFRLAVKSLASVYAAPPDLKPATLRGLLECASKLLGRLGLDPVTAQTIDLPPPPRDEEDDELSEFESGNRIADLLKQR